MGPFTRSRRRPQGEKGKVRGRRGGAMAPCSLSKEPPLGLTVPLNLRRILTVFMNGLAPLLVVATTYKVRTNKRLRMTLLRGTVLVTNVMALIRMFAVKPINNGLPVIVKADSNFVNMYRDITKIVNGKIITCNTVVTTSFVNNLFRAMLKDFLGPLEGFFPSIMAKAIMLSVNLSLVTINVDSFKKKDSTGSCNSLRGLFMNFMILIMVIMLGRKAGKFADFTSVLVNVVMKCILMDVVTTILPAAFACISSTNTAMRTAGS